MHYLETGGAETALIGLLHALDKGNLEVDLFLNEHRGAMMKYIPDWVNILPEEKQYSIIEQSMMKALRKGQWKVVLGRIIAKIKYLRYVKKNNPKEGSAVFGYVGRYINPFLPSLKKYGEYDLAISFLTPHNIVLEKVSAKKKICWIHTDYSTIDVDAEIELPVWEGYDRIVSISHDVSAAFLKVFPSLFSKIIEIENPLPVKLILDKSREFVPSEMKKHNDEIILLTIGRYCHAKNLESIPYICRGLIDKGQKVKWFIVGYGGADYEEKIIKEIKRLDVEKNVIMLGKKENPYPYIKACDWYVQPSRYEGKSVTVREAQILGKPVIVTDYPTALSQINNGVDGVIVPSNINETDNAMAFTISENKLKNKISENNAKSDYSSIKEVSKLLKLITG